MQVQVQAIPYQPIEGNFLWNLGDKIAENIVYLFASSNKFTKTDYPGQMEFYATYRAKYNELVEYAAERCLHHQVFSNQFESDIYLITTVLDQLIALKILNFTHLLIIFTTVLLKADECQQVAYSSVQKNVFKEYVLPITRRSTVDDLVSLLHSKTVDKRVPFITRRGVFGFNVALYLMANDLFPIAVSTIAPPVHGGDYSTPAKVLVHDLLHTKYMLKPITQKEWPQFQQLYKRLMTMAPQMPPGQVQSLVLALFSSIHENQYIFACNGQGRFHNAQPEELVKLVTEDQAKFRLDAGYYTPEMFGQEPVVVASIISSSHNLNGIQVGQQLKQAEEQGTLDQWLQAGAWLAQAYDASERDLCSLLTN